MGTVRLDADALGALEHHLPVLQAHLQDVVSSGVALGHSTLMKTKRVVSDYHYYARLITLPASSTVWVVKSDNTLFIFTVLRRRSATAYMGGQLKTVAH